MKHAGAIATAAVVVFWVAANTQLVLRDLELRSMDRYELGVRKFLGTALRREEWLGIYAEHKKVGFAGFTLERVNAQEGLEFHASIETVWRGTLPLPITLPEEVRISNELSVRGSLVFDHEMKPLHLRLELSLHLLEGSLWQRKDTVTLAGERSGGRFALKVRLGEQEVVLPLPIDHVVLSDGIGMSMPIAGYEVGETYHVRVFDPLSALASIIGLGGRVATVRVLEKETTTVSGVLADVFKLETKCGAMVAHSWVTSSGQTLRQELGPPLNVVLKKEASREQAQRGIKSP